MRTLYAMRTQRTPLDVLYLDFAKAFDKVPHRRLLEKCRGLDGKLLEWIRVWLEGRKQRVVLNGEASEWTEVLSAVPQGSVMGPTLFLIFINDIDKAVDVTSSVLLQFADNTKVARVVK
jgi:ribonuclease P/MRP protein subunit RPP40